MKKVLLLFIFVSNSLSALTVTGGQGYGTFNLTGAGSTKAGSIMYAGLRFNKYLELKYVSLDTSIRMPVLPFRLIDTNYNSRVVNGKSMHTTYDSDTFCLNVSLPVYRGFVFSVMYGIGQAKVTELTALSTSGDFTATIHKGFVQALDIQTSMDFNITDKFLFTPAIGFLKHFLDNRSAYKSANSVYVSAAVSYKLEN